MSAFSITACWYVLLKAVSPLIITLKNAEDRGCFAVQSRNALRRSRS
jgi:hypothetical protein